MIIIQYDSKKGEVEYVVVGLNTFGQNLNICQWQMKAFGEPEITNIFEALSFKIAQ